VALALLGLVEKPVDLVIAGINGGPNLGHDVTYSGTVTAAMEAAIFDISGVAVSLDTPKLVEGALDYGPAAVIASRIVATVIASGAGLAGKLLNVNVPYLPLEQIKGIQVTRQGQRIYADELVPRTDPRGRPYYWIGGEAPSGVPDEGTDIGALSQGYVSVTPLQLDLTAHKLLQTMQSWTW
jgi:5'-nucleotidase